jgi:hypothetical protein
MTIAAPHPLTVWTMAPSAPRDLAEDASFDAGVYRLGKFVCAMGLARHRYHLNARTLRHASKQGLSP